MLGQPKYTYGDIVVFRIDNKEVTAVVAIIDRFGTFFDNSDVSYDLLDKKENILYKHIREDLILKKVDHIDEKDIW